MTQRWGSSMRKGWAAVLIGLMGVQAFASDLVISPPGADGSGCDLFVAGFDSKEPFLKFFEQLKQAAAKKDKSALSGLILYPLRVNGKNARTIRTRADFLSQFDSLFTSRVQTVIEKQQLDRLFCRDQGIMFGGGEIWVGLSKGKVGIKTLNLPR